MAQNFNSLNRHIIGTAFCIGDKIIINKKCNINIPDSRITARNGTFKGDIEEIVIAHKDRLCRFGYELLSYIFEKHGVKLVVLNDETKSA